MRFIHFVIQKTALQYGAAVMMIDSKFLSSGIRML